ncbi:MULTISPECIES: glycoside hydrolase family 26 protein [unclassified Fibrobacter]|uniref:glycoside hydrolase family 26 protein n=1 Tax=unclassified Fibrobacter TaxID=2634177 RepID=UPI0025BEBEB9|nr:MULTISPECIES: glycosyl hydrolase [unclassified Fibrobacter]
MNKFLFSMVLAPVAAMAFQVGAWVGGPGQYPQPTQQNVQAFQDLQGTHLDLISYFALFDINDWNATAQYANVAKNNGSTLVVTWMANGYNAQELVNGKADNYIREYAKGVKGFGDEIWLRPLHEANGDWYDWGVGKSGAGNTDANVAEAFRHIVKIFKEEGVTNVKWVWTTNASNQGSGTTLTGNYPGDEYVDYISIDGYNWGKCQSWSSWQTFSQVFKKAYNALANIDKPLFIAEISSSELGGNKAEWITDMFEHFATDFSRVFAVMWFSQSKEANEGDWALNTSQAAVDAWKAGIAKMKAMAPESSSSEAIPESSSSVNSSSSTTAIRTGGITDKFSFRQQGGKLLLQVDRAMTASVVQFDHQGRILWQSAVQHFTPGKHMLEVPEAGTRSIYRLNVLR